MGNQDRERRRTGPRHTESDNETQERGTSCQIREKGTESQGKRATGVS